MYHGYFKFHLSKYLSSIHDSRNNIEPACNSLCNFGHVSAGSRSVPSWTDVELVLRWRFRVRALPGTPLSSYFYFLSGPSGFILDTRLVPPLWGRTGPGPLSIYFFPIFIHLSSSPSHTTITQLAKFFIATVRKLSTRIWKKVASRKTVWKLL